MELEVQKRIALIDAQIIELVTRRVAYVAILGSGTKPLPPTPVDVTDVIDIPIAQSTTAAEMRPYDNSWRKHEKPRPFRPRKRAKKTVKGQLDTDALLREVTNALTASENGLTLNELSDKCPSYRERYSNKHRITSAMRNHINLFGDVFKIGRIGIAPRGERKGKGHNSPMAAAIVYGIKH